MANHRKTIASIVMIHDGMILLEKKDEKKFFNGEAKEQQTCDQWSLPSFKIGSKESLEEIREIANQKLSERLGAQSVALNESSMPFLKKMETKRRSEKDRTRAQSKIFMLKRNTHFWQQVLGSLSMFSSPEEEDFKIEPRKTYILDGLELAFFPVEEIFKVDEKELMDITRLALNDKDVQLQIEEMRAVQTV